MSSTEFRIGLDGSRSSSKVLKPPGGGSSDIFGFGASHQESTKTSRGAQNEPATTKNRLFGNDPPTTSSVPQTPKSEVLSNSQITQSQKKRIVRRNPITGEEIEYNLDNSVQDNKNGTGENENEEENKNNTNIVPPEEEKTVPVKPVQTSIRVKNPPGGKSSGIFF